MLKLRTSLSWGCTTLVGAVLVGSIGCSDDADIDALTPDAGVVAAAGNGGQAGAAGQPSDSTPANVGGAGGSDMVAEPPPSEPPPSEPPPPAPPAPEVCDVYCDGALANCTGDNQLYPDRESCLAACASMPVGDPADMAGNTASCRAYHAGAPAAGDPALHCPHASASGEGVCGSPCEGYCNQAMGNCTGDNALYVSVAQCVAACEVFPDTDGEFSATGGNSVECRTYHASFPAAGEPAVHCPHAGVSGGGVCGQDPCPTYCTNALANCTGANQLYADEASCLTACRAMPIGEPTDPEGNSAWCRAYHAGVPAAGDPATHCPHASASGEGACGSACEGYCNQARFNCTGDNGLFADRQACLSTCEAYPQDGGFGATGGNSVQCRTYHASFPAAGAPAVHCPHASATGEGVCGSSCEGYCNQAQANCAGDNALFASGDECLAACDDYPQRGRVSDTAGDSVQCRTYHASFPAQGDPALHCPHAGVDGGGVCVPAPDDPCPVYCENALDNCTGDNVLYADFESCLTTCQAMPVGEPTDIAGNTAWCRAYHAGAPAAADPALHCQHASASGAGVCGEPCEAYCDQVLTNCVGEEDSLFADRASCLTTCQAYPSGTFQDTSGNSVECRIYHASFPSAGDPSVHCPHASASGQGVCGSACEGYCNQAQANCTEANALFASADECLTSCQLYPQNGDVRAIDGDSVQCRTYHASFPAAGDPALHCSHAGLTGGGVCADLDDPCPVYCENALANCTGDNEIYASIGQCLASCRAMPVGDPADTAGNTAWCRAYHAGTPAAGDPGLHCQHAGVGGGGVCGDDLCEVYCDQVQTNCSGDNAAFASRGDCLSACRAFPSDPSASPALPTGGNSVECRTYHASFPSAGDPATHCQHASASGGNVCGNLCDGYCNQALVNCGADDLGEAALYANRSQCQAACEAFPADNFQAVSGNSVECRTYHASFPAAGNPALHCPHASVNGDNVCGSLCDAYCSQVANNCNDEVQLFEDIADCPVACAGLPVGGFDDIVGNTVQCRVYHASFPALRDPLLHCPHAAIDAVVQCVDP